MKLKCALTSDTHLGSSIDSDSIHLKFWESLALENVDVVFWAGDLISHKQNQFERTIRQARSILPDIKIILCRGNHDFWQDEFFKLGKNAPVGSGTTEYYRYRQKVSMSKPYSRPMNWSEMMSFHKDVFDKYKIIHLDGMCHELSSDVVVIGYDGWYSEANVYQLQTNDYKFMPEMIDSAPAHIYLRNKAEKDLDRILNIDTDGKIVIGITHMPPFTQSNPVQDYSVVEKWNANGSFLGLLTDKCDYLLVGHNHKPCDLIYNDCRIINSGSDYNKPKFVIFEV